MTRTEKCRGISVTVSFEDIRQTKTKCARVVSVPERRHRGGASVGEHTCVDAAHRCGACAEAMAAVRSSAVVVGGGFVGLSCAIHLQRLGKHVILMEAGPSVGGLHSCSSGNAGTFAFYANVPTQRPGLWREAPGMILSTKGALRVAFGSHLTKMVPWCLGALASCAPSEVRKTALALGTLLRHAEAGYNDAWEHCGIDIDGEMGIYAPNKATACDAFAARRGYLLLQKDVHNQNSQSAAALRREGWSGGSLKMEALDQSGVRGLEPHLSYDVTKGGAWWFEDGWFLKNPRSLLRAMRDGFVAKGGEIRCGDFGRVESVAHGTTVGSVRLTMRDGTNTETNTAVIAAGAHSANLAKQCGDHLPLDTERGYSVQWSSCVPETETEKTSPPALTRPVCSSEGGFIVSPMAGGVRAAGLVELGGIELGPVSKRFTQLDHATRALFDPDAFAFGERDTQNDWLGFRPTLPDALPVIGKSSKFENVLYAFGHQHIGWTLGGITGRVVAAMAVGKNPGVDLDPFSPKRFASKAWWRLFASL